MHNFKKVYVNTDETEIVHGKPFPMYQYGVQLLHFTYILLWNDSRV